MRDPEEILADDPGSVVFSRYAEQLAREGRIDQAVDVLKRGIRANPFHAPGYSVLAELLFQLESEEEAVENIMSALRLDPQMPRDLFRLGTHFLNRDPSKAESLLKAAFAYEPESEEVTASFEKARLLVESSVRRNIDISGGVGDHSLIAEELSGDRDAAPGFEELKDTALEGGDVPEPLQKPSAPVNQEDQDFLALMGEQGVGTIDEELDSLFHSLESKAGRETLPPQYEPEERVSEKRTVSAEAVEGERAPDLKPVVPEAGEKDRADEDEERKASDVVSEPGPEELLSGSLDEVISEEPPAEYGIADLEMEAESEGILEINDEEEYDLARFGYNSIPEEELPMLSEAERIELIALTVPHVNETGEKEEAEDGLGLGDLSLEDLEKPDNPEVDERTAEPSGDYSALEDDAGAPGTPINAPRADEIEMEDLAGEGIDYSDVLSTWKLPGEESVPSAGVESESLSITDILKQLEEREDGSFEENPPSGSTADEPIIRVISGSETEIIGKPESPEPETAAQNEFSFSIPDESAPPGENDGGGIPAASRGGAGAFALPMMDGLFEMENPFNPLTVEQAALIDDFISGKEPEPEIPDAISPAPNIDDRDAPVPEQVFSAKDRDYPIEFGAPMIHPETENFSETVVPRFPPEPVGGPSVTVDEGRFPIFSPGIDISDVSARSAPPAGTAGSLNAVWEEAVVEESLGDLISLYANIIDTHPASRQDRPAAPSPRPVPPPSEPKPSPVREMEPKPRSASKPLGSYTATMAEIYVSQGLITRAMEIYTVLAENNPGSEQYRLRLAELKRMHEQQPDAS